MTCNRSVVSSTNKTYLHDITDILLKMVLNTTILTLLEYMFLIFDIHVSQGDIYIPVYNNDPN
jgi:hypothetical protein